MDPMQIGAFQTNSASNPGIIKSYETMARKGRNSWQTLTYNMETVF